MLLCTQFSRPEAGTVAAPDEIVSGDQSQGLEGPFDVLLRHRDRFSVYHKVSLHSLPNRTRNLIVLRRAKYPDGVSQDTQWWAEAATAEY
jgi:hypothetical protein